MAAISGRPKDHVTEDGVTPAKSHVTAASKDRVVGGGRGCVGEALKSRLVGLLLVVLLWSVLLMYAETAGFLVELVAMTSLGLVLNPGSEAARRLVLVVWSVVYVVACYRSALGSYVDFSRAVFSTMKRRLADRLLRHAHGDHAHSDHVQSDHAHSSSHAHCDHVHSEGAQPDHNHHA